MLVCICVQSFELGSYGYAEDESESKREKEWQASMPFFGWQREPKNRAKMRVRKFQYAMKLWFTFLLYVLPASISSYSIWYTPYTSENVCSRACVLSVHGLKCPWLRISIHFCFFKQHKKLIFCLPIPRSFWYCIVTHIQTIYSERTTEMKWRKKNVIITWIKI